MRTKLTLLLTVLIMFIAAAMPLVLSSVHSWPTHAAPPAAVTIPSMKLPWDRSLTTIPLTGGPFGNYPDKGCTLENKSIMSGVDFGLPQNTDVLAVAAGKVIYAGYTNNLIRNEVRIDHGGGFVTEYWALNSIDPSIVTGVYVAQGQLLGKSGYTPCPKCKNGISVHLRLEFRQYTSDPLLNTPLSAHGMAIDGYKIWTFVKPSTGQGYNFQGTMTRGKTIIKFQSECGVNGVKTWYSLNGPTILAIANGTGGFLTSTNLITTHVGCGTWSVIPSPNAGVLDIFNGVVALSSSDVWAVGYEEPTSSLPEQTLIEHWNGTMWSIIPSPSIGAYLSDLNGVTALSTNDVWAVGNYYTSSNNGQSLNGHTLVEHWDGTSWNIIASPDVGTVDNILRGVTSAPGSKQLWAVGYAWDTSSFQTLIEHWDGTSWTVVPGASLGTIDNSFEGITARSVNDIWAVGSYGGDSSSTSQALIEHWNGIAWSLVPSNTNHGLLESVTLVPNTNQLWAVGYYTQASGSRPTLTEHWDGATWSPVPSPSPRTQGPHSFDGLFGVAAIAPNNVWAIGYSYHAPTLVERWDGKKWYIIHILLAGVNDELFGVTTVPNSKQLWTVGAYGTSNTFLQTLVEVRC